MAPCLAEILEQGDIASYDGQTTREVALLTLVVERPDSADPLIAELGDPDWLEWMHRNFWRHRRRRRSSAARRATRGGSSTTRGTGRDQIAWVVERLRDDPECRSAAITTFQPLTDTSYIPCVSLLDFWLRDGPVELVVYAHSLDFGKKAYGNLVELAHLAGARRGRARRAVGPLVVHVKSAHVYEPEWAAMAEHSPGSPPQAS